MMTKLSKNSLRMTVVLGDLSKPTLQQLCLSVLVSETLVYLNRLVQQSAQEDFIER
jgi:hypothetical protein